MNTADLIHGALLDAAGICIAQGVFPLCALPAFSVAEQSGYYVTDFSIVAQDTLNMPCEKIAQHICEHLIYCGDIEIKSVEPSDGKIKIYI